MAWVIGDEYKAHAPLKGPIRCLGVFQAQEDLKQADQFKIGRHEFLVEDKAQAGQLVVMYEVAGAKRLGLHSRLSNDYYGSFLPSSGKPSLMKCRIFRLNQGEELGSTC